jgi:AcrR family transcriptional regulator
MSTRAEKAAQTRVKILDAARRQVQNGTFYTSSMEELADEAGVTRVTLYRIFGTRQDLSEALFFEMAAAARLDLIDEAVAMPDVRDALPALLLAYCEMYAALGESMPLALQLGRADSNMKEILDAFYWGGRRPTELAQLAKRIVREGAAADGWTAKSVTDALLVLTSYECYETLIRRGLSVKKTAAQLTALARAFLSD